MDLSSVRRVSSAGYRLPERTRGTRPVSTEPPAERTRRGNKRDPASPQLDQDRIDTVKQDQVWKDVVWNERRGVREWEKNWGFLRNYDHMEPSRSSTSLSSEHVSNTSNEMFGSRLSTPLGLEVVRLDRLLLWSGSHHKRKQDPELLPC
uniref:Uncharacterized protein n=1 Tax=Mola mola TaxID=94237 RepID=A0A3Q3WBI8_MOLML